MLSAPRLCCRNSVLRAKYCDDGIGIEGGARGPLLKVRFAARARAMRALYCVALIMERRKWGVARPASERSCNRGLRQPLTTAAQETL